MKVQIWSDVMCPFCYIGKRHFEEALSAFEHSDVVEVEWKSFQLNPALKTNPNISVYQSLADSKGWNLDYAKQLSNQVTEMAQQAGLQYNFDRAVVANSFNAHRLSHLAKKHGLGDALEERLFKAYFTDGLNIDDKEALVNISTEIGLKAEEVTAVLDSNVYADEVYQDIHEAETLNIRGVPFFVINNRYAVSGAQATEVFLNTIKTAYSEWQQQPKTLEITDGPSCDANGNC
ncbi:DsbA family oxidoreductase [Mucilaginibacter sp. PAMB04168]|uniref:DsbA family oxidoreductase n=1 Tax=Mucilaginibacter sp. PAMB04168 TaxID=3138567 RepID=UPI0031F6CEF2